jgi:outer membrane receptor protein involved in Fe transport
LAGTRVRTDLKDVASAISVVTAQFLQDTGAKNAQDLLVYTPSTEVAGLRGNFSAPPDPRSSRKTRFPRPPAFAASIRPTTRATTS